MDDSHVDHHRITAIESDIQTLKSTTLSIERAYKNQRSVLQTIYRNQQQLSESVKDLSDGVETVRHIDFQQSDQIKMMSYGFKSLWGVLLIIGIMQFSQTEIRDRYLKEVLPIALPILAAAAGLTGQVVIESTAKNKNKAQTAARSKR